MGHHEHRKPITTKLITAETTKTSNTNENAARRNKDKYIRAVLEKEYEANGNSFDKIIYAFVIHDIKALVKKELMPYVERGEIKALVVKSMMDSITKPAVERVVGIMKREKALGIEAREKDRGE